MFVFNTRSQKKKGGLQVVLVCEALTHEGCAVSSQGEPGFCEHEEVQEPLDKAVEGRGQPASEVCF